MNAVSFAGRKGTGRLDGPNRSLLWLQYKILDCDIWDKGFSQSSNFHQQLKTHNRSLHHKLKMERWTSERQYTYILLYSNFNCLSVVNLSLRIVIKLIAIHSNCHSFVFLYIVLYLDRKLQITCYISVVFGFTLFYCFGVDSFLVLARVEARCSHWCLGTSFRWFIDVHQWIRDN